MKKLTIKAMATIVVVLVAVSLTFAPNLYAGDPELPGTINPNPEEGGGVHITCKCTIIGSKVCAANGNGKTCAGGDNMKCWEYNQNCA